MLKLTNITKIFGEKKVIDNVSLQVGRGEIAVLLGSSGVGKSTLLRLLNNLEAMDAGEISLDNTMLNLKDINATHKVGMVFQQFNLFEHLTVLENITLPLEKAAKKSKEVAKAIALELLAHYGLQDKANVYCNKLSGGQKQRLAIARAVALKPTVICMDEPTSALDPLLTTHVANTIQALANEGYVVLVATHDVALIERLGCTIYLMKDGRIIESVSSKDFLADRSKFPAIAQFVSGNA